MLTILKNWLLHKLLTTHPIYKNLGKCKALKRVVQTDTTSYVFVVEDSGCTCFALSVALAHIKQDLEKQLNHKIFWSLIIKTESEFEEILALERMIRK